MMRIKFYTKESDFLYLLNLSVYERIKYNLQTKLSIMSFTAGIFVRKLDMIIIPRSDSMFNRCKSNLKFLENSMLEIPSVCQSFSTGDSPYEENHEDGECRGEEGREDVVSR